MTPKSPPRGSRCAWALLVGALVTSSRATAQCDLVPMPIEEQDVWIGRDLAVVGDRLVLSASPISAQVGSVVVMQRTADGWREEATLTADATNYNGIGSQVAMTAGRIAFTSNGFPASDRITFYARDGSGWAFEDEIFVDDTTELCLLGDELFVGSLETVEVFRRSRGTWDHVQTLAASKSGPLSTQYGHRIVATEDDLLVSASEAPAHDVHDSGIVYAYRRDGASWVLVQQLGAPIPEVNAHYGASIAVAGDVLFVGAPHEDEMLLGRVDDAGAVYVYDRGPTGWTLDARLTSEQIDDDEDFGFSVATNGELLLASSFRSVEVFRKEGQEWIVDRRFDAKAVTDHTTAPTSFGTGVAFWGDRAIVSAPYAHTLTLEDGVVFGEPLDSDVNVHLDVNVTGLLFPNGTTSQEIEIRTCVPQPDATYLMLGSLGGHKPFIDLGGPLLPLVIDDYTVMTAAQANSGAFVNTFGVLDAAGEALASIEVPFELAPKLSGTVLTHAVMVFGQDFAPESVSTPFKTSILWFP